MRTAGFGAEVTTGPRVVLDHHQPRQQLQRLVLLTSPLNPTRFPNEADQDALLGAPLKSEKVNN